MTSHDIRFTRAYRSLEQQALDECSSEYQALMRELVASAPAEFRAQFLRIALEGGVLPAPVACNLEGWPLWKAVDIAALHQMTVEQLQESQPPFWILTAECSLSE